MTRIREIIENNKGIDFVVMTHNKNEFEILRDILIDMVVCEIEGWDKLAYLKSLKDVIEHFEKI